MIANLAPKLAPVGAAIRAAVIRAAVIRAAVIRAAVISAAVIRAAAIRVDPIPLWFLSTSAQAHLKNIALGKKS